MSDKEKPTDPASKGPAPDPQRIGADGKPMEKEIGGAKGPEPTRYGDWEKKGIISDF